jgi:surfactin synthase thioesterase subunit
LDQIHTWANVTTGTHNTYEMKGNHFFILNQAEGISDIINKTIVRELNLNTLNMGFTSSFD